MGIERVLEAKQEYIRLQQKVEELTALATKITPTLSDTPVSGGYRLKDDTWATLIDYKASCDWQLQLYLKCSKELEEELDCIRNTNIRTAMKYRYVDCKTIEEIASKMTYDRRTIDRYLCTGRRLYEKYYPEKSR